MALGWIVFIGAKDGPEAQRLGFKLLDAENPWMQLAGNVALGLTTFRASPPDFRRIRFQGDPPPLDQTFWDAYRGRTWEPRDILKRAILADLSRRADQARTKRPSTPLESEMGGRLHQLNRLLRHPDGAKLNALRGEDVDAFMDAYPSLDSLFTLMQSLFPISSILP